MSESQAIDQPRVWWKEVIKRRRVRLFDAAAGRRARATATTWSSSGCRPTGSPWATTRSTTTTSPRAADGWRDATPTAGDGLPDGPYFLAVSRFVPEKNLVRLIEAFAALSRRADAERRPWDLVLCGDGPGAAEVDAAIAASGLRRGDPPAGVPPGRRAGALVCATPRRSCIPSLMEPWGLVVNEAAACGLPLLVSDRAGCVETLVPEPGRDHRRAGSTRATSRRWPPRWPGWPGCPSDERRAMGRRAAEVVADWGPDRFAAGTLEALETAPERSRPARRPSRSTWPRSEARMTDR